MCIVCIKCLYAYLLQNFYSICIFYYFYDVSMCYIIYHILYIFFHPYTTVLMYVCVRYIGCGGCVSPYLLLPRVEQSDRGAEYPCRHGMRAYSIVLLRV